MVAIMIYTSIILSTTDRKRKTFNVNYIEIVYYKELAL